MSKEKMKKVNNSITIITTVLYLVAIMIYELLFCNSDLMSHLLRGATVENVAYHFSWFRMLLYVIFLGVWVGFRNYFTKDLLQNNANKVKKTLVITYSMLAVIGIILVTIFIFTKNIPLPRIAMLYIAIIMGEICLVYLSNDYVKNIIIFTITLAMIMVVTVDINNAIDENKHFMSAYDVALGNFNYTENPQMDKRFFELGTRVKYTEISDLFKNDFQEDLSAQINKDIISETPADYSPITYLPSAAGILIAKILSHNMADIYYAGRLFNLLTFMALMVVTFKLLPYKKNVFFVIATMPMVFLMSTVYSADMLCIGVTFIFTAYCLNLYQREHIGIKQIIGLIAMFLILCIPKSMAYIFVAFMVLMLPIKKIIQENKKYIPYVIFIVIAIGGIILYTLMNQQVADDPRGGDTSKVEQIKYIQEHPTHLIKVGVNHLRLSLFDFNWLSQLNMSLFFCDISFSIFLVMLIYILLVSFLDTSKNFKIKDKMILIIAFFLTYGATSAMLYLTFTPVGSKTIEGYQARYIFPILPLVLMTLSSNWVEVKKKENVNTLIACISGMFLILGVIGNIMVL